MYMIDFGMPPYGDYPAIGLSYSLGIVNVKLLNDLNGPGFWLQVTDSGPEPECIPIGDCVGRAGYHGLYIPGLIFAGPRFQVLDHKFILFSVLLVLGIGNIGHIFHFPPPLI